MATPLPENLQPLFAELLDGELDDAARQQLEALIRENPDVRRLYLEYCAMHAMLQWEHGVMTGLETIPAARASAQKVQQPRRFWAWTAVASVACVTLALLGTLLLRPQPQTEVAAPLPVQSISGEFAAQITGSNNARFNAQPALVTGSQLRQGQRVHLASGYAEITFNCGAQVVLEGPVLLDVESAWSAVLHEGPLRATVPPQAVGFRVSAPSVDVIDLGTEFSLIAEPNGETEVAVMKGAVRAEWTGAAAAIEKPIVLTKSQARRFGRKGSSEITDAERKARRWEKIIEFERLTAVRDYAHLSFDEKGGKPGLRVDSVGASSGSIVVPIRTTSGKPPQRVAGRFNNALQLLGDGSTRVPLAGAGSITARTFAFWMRIPADGTLSDGNVVLSWERRVQKHGWTQVLELGWNNNPADGTLGALRLERGKGFVIGSTPLRDGQWHHIAVVIVPDDLSSSTVSVNLYIDGKLEGVTSRRGKQRRAEETELIVESNDDPPEFLFIGRSAHPQRDEKFRGDIDELYVVESALTPAEIQRLISDNHLAVPAK